MILPLSLAKILHIVFLFVLWYWDWTMGLMLAMYIFKLMFSSMSKNITNKHPYLYQWKCQQPKNEHKTEVSVHPLCIVEYKPFICSFQRREIKPKRSMARNTKYYNTSQNDVIISIINSGVALEVKSSNLGSHYNSWWLTSSNLWIKIHPDILKNKYFLFPWRTEKERGREPRFIMHFIDTDSLRIFISTL